MKSGIAEEFASPWISRQVIYSGLLGMSSLATCNPAAPVPFMSKVGCETLTARVRTCRQGEDVPVQQRWNIPKWAGLFHAILLIPFCFGMGRGGVRGGEFAPVCLWAAPWASLISLWLEVRNLPAPSLLVRGSASAVGSQQPHSSSSSKYWQPPHVKFWKH